MLFQSIYSQDKLILDDEFKSVKSTHDLFYVVDTLKVMQIDEVISNQDFKINKKSFFGKTNLRVWYRLDVENISNKLKEFVFAINTECVKDLTIYKDVDHQVQEVYSLKRIKEKDFNIPVSIVTNKLVTYYFKVDFTKSTYFPLEIFEKNNFSKHQTQNQLELGFFYGISFIILLINIFFYLNTKDKFYLFYSILLLSIILILAEIDGFFSDFFFVRYIDVLLQLMLVVFLSLFTNEAIGVKKYYPKTVSFIFIFILVNTLFYSVFIVTYDVIWYTIGKILNTTILLTYLFIGFLLFNKEVYARFSVIGYLTLFISNILYILPYDFGLNYFGFTNRHLKMSSLFEMVVFLYAISYRHRVLKDTLSNRIKKDLSVEKSNEDLFQEFIKKHNLTLRETEIVNNILLGKTNKEISETLFIQEVTVKYHISNIFRKLEIKKRTELAPMFLNFKLGQ